MHTGPNVSLKLLLARIAASPIIITASEPRDFAGWCRRQPADIDVVILDWLRSQRPQRSALS